MDYYKLTPAQVETLLTALGFDTEYWGETKDRTDALRALESGPALTRMDEPPSGSCPTCGVEAVKQ